MVFMSNACNHPYCKQTNCDKCFFYTPKFFGIKVPKFIGNVLYKIEYILNRGK